MANIFEQKERRMIPNWRSFDSTVKLAELHSSILNNERIINYNLSINDYLNSWHYEKSISNACDLISAAFVNNLCDNIEVKEAASFLINEKDTPKSALQLARFIHLDDEKLLNNTSLIPTIDQILQQNHFYESVKKYKQLILNQPLNPILYVDLSRLYSILGIKDKAIANMKIAVNLAKNNRFVLRAAARLFVHYSMPDYIHAIIKKSEFIGEDPWLISTEIALSSFTNKTSKLIKKGIHIIDSDKYLPESLAELIASLGTLEFFNGSDKKAKKYFRKMLQAPNDNSLAQLAWINSNHMLIHDINPSVYDVKNNYEAIALNSLENSQYNETLIQAKNWFLDLPFSKRSVMLGSFVANSFLEDTKSAKELLRAGLNSHPGDPQLLNNLAFSLSLENNPNEAETEFQKIDLSKEISINTKICLKATWGLISIKKGNIEQGKYYYNEAITEAKAIKSNYLFWLAKLNFARALILANQNNSTEINSLLDVPSNTLYKDVNKLKNDTLFLLKTKSNQ